MSGGYESQLGTDVSSATPAMGERPQRRHYLDNIRWAVVLIVLVYHVIYQFNALGVPGSVGAETDIRAFDTFLYLVFPWFMGLLFVVAGISSRYSLQTRSVKQFFTDRLIKLVAPATLGLLVYQWVLGCVSLKVQGFYDAVPKILLYPVSVMASWWSHLWFIQSLALFSGLLILVRLIDRHDRLWRWGGKANIWVVLLLVVPVVGAAQILTLPGSPMYRFGVYGLLFFLGYAVFSHDAVQQSLMKLRLPMLAAALALGIGYTVYYFGTNYASYQAIQGVLFNVFAWAAILAIMGCGKAWFNGTNRFTAYMSRVSYGYYIVHYPIVAWTAYLLYHHAHLPLILNYVIALVVELVGTVALYELFSRIPGVRFAVLGIWKRVPHSTLPGM